MPYRACVPPIGGIRTLLMRAVFQVGQLCIFYQDIGNTVFLKWICQFHGLQDTLCKANLLPGEYYGERDDKPYSYISPVYEYIGQYPWKHNHLQMFQCIA